MTNRSLINKGFTLIELMIVVAIIGILVAVVMPNYRNYVLESQRTDTQGKLLQMIELEERYYIDNFTYTADLKDDLGYSADPVIISYSGTPAFSISASACPNGVPYFDNPGLNRCFILTATALGDQVDDGNLLIDNRGRKEHELVDVFLRDWDGNDL
jgi:type IV pilus assembly protein PilE